MSALERTCSVALAVERADLDDALARLDAIGAGIHPERTADTAGYAVIEMETADAGLQRRGGDALVGRRRARADAGGRDHLCLAKAFCRQPHDEPGNAAFADQKVRADADDGDRHVLGHRLQERREIFLVGRLEQRVGEAAGAEPGDLVHLGVGRDAPAQGRSSRRQAWQKVAALRFMPTSRSSSLGSAYAQYVMLPAPRNTTKSPGLARSRTIGAICCGPSM